MSADMPSNFCHRCGANLGEQDLFCPSCGAYSDRGANEPVMKPQGPPDGGRGARLTVSLILSAVWSIAGVLLGLWMVVGAEFMAEYSWTMISDLYPSMTVGEFVDMIVFQGWLTLGSGAAAAAAALLCYLRRHRLIAVAACIIGGVLALFPTAYVGGIIAFAVAFLVYTSKPPAFKD
jgi:hypothetical protein